MGRYHINRVERIKDLRHILTDRWGPRLPNDETGRKLLAVVIDHAVLIAPDFAERMAQQLAPAEISDAEISYMIDRAGAGRMWGPKELANAIGLTEVERVRLQVTTIAATDCTRNQRKAKRRLAKLSAATAERESLDAGATAR